VINYQLILDRISDINSSLKRLEEIRLSGLSNFLVSNDLEDIASFQLIKLIEGCLTICQHISAKVFKIAPDSYSNCFELLAKNNLIPSELSTNLQKMARFRNMLIHVYWNIDYKQVFEIIQNHLVDVRKFVAILDDLINRELL